MTDPLAGLVEALRDRYRLEDEVGRGGVAIVFRAHDVRHDRWVALKLLHHDLVGAADAERFRDAVRTAARLQHPHILAVHDSGEDGGRRWFTTPFVRGETLRARLRRDGWLPVGEALRIAREAADALDYAHREGVVHRELSPTTIALAEGHALVTDFGIARTLGAEDGDAGPAYLSPEQATGGTVDARTDVYGLGVVLYEMLLGEPPFTGPTPQAVIARLLTESPLPPRAIRASVPASVEAIVLRALASDPASRFPSAAAMRDALDDAMAGLHAIPVRPPPSTPIERAVSLGPWLWPLVLTFLGGLLVGAGLWFAK